MPRTELVPQLGVKFFLASVMAMGPHFQTTVPLLSLKAVQSKSEGSGYEQGPQSLSTVEKSFQSGVGNLGWVGWEEEICFLILAMT